MMSHRLWLHKYIPTLKSDCICIFCIQTSLLFFQVLSFPMSPRAVSPSPLHKAPVCYHTRLTILIPHPWPLATTQPANAAIQTVPPLTQFSAQSSYPGEVYAELPRAASPSPWPLYLILCISSHARGGLCSILAQDG